MTERMKYDNLKNNLSRRRKRSVAAAFSFRYGVITIGKKSAKKSELQQTMIREKQISLRASLLISLGFGCLYFLAVCLCAQDTIKTVSLVLAVLSLLAIAFRRNVIRERIFLPFLALSLFVIMNGISSFYAISGKFALREFLKVLSAFCLVLLILTMSPVQEKRPGTRAAAALAVCGALGSLISIDLLSTRLISGAVLGFLTLFTDEYTWLSGVEAGNRMTSLFTNPNVFAGFSGIAVLLSLGLASEAEKRSERNYYLVLLYINALAFLLAFSLGASIFILAAFLVFLFLLPREKRGGNLILMLETLLLVIISAGLISTTSFREWSGIQPIPLACAVVGAALLCVLDLFVGKRISAWLNERSKIIPYTLAAVFVLIAAYVIVAWNITGAGEVSEGVTLRRAMYLEPGEYSMDIQASGSVTVRIVSQNKRETMLHTSERLYYGKATKATFTVPEDSLVQYFSFSAKKNVTIEAASVGGQKIPLKYLLLPGFMANRLQGLLANENAIQRLVFFEDGIKLFKRSPIIGLGMGAYENGIKSVQTFYYETKYAHDHYIEVLVQVGIVGLVLFLALLVISAIAIWRSRKSQPYAPVLGAALVFMAGHAAVEVVFSTFVYLPMAYGVFALINLCCGSALPKPSLSKLAKNIVMGILAACIFIYGIFVACNIAADRLLERQHTLNSVVTAVRLDKFEWADYALAYVNNTMDSDVSLATRIQADEYAERLSGVSSNTVPIYLARYYFSTNRMEKGLQMVEKYVDYVSSDPSAWQTAFNLLMAVETDTDVYRDGVKRIAKKLDDWNGQNMGDIQVSEETEAFLAKYLSN